MPFVILNIKRPKFQPHYKVICDFKNFNLESYISDFKLVPLNLVYAIDDPDEQVSFFNQLILQCINERVPLMETKQTQPPAPRMKFKTIAKLKAERDQLCKKAFYLQNNTNMHNYCQKMSLLKTQSIPRRLSFPRQLYA